MYIKTFTVTFTAMAATMSFASPVAVPEAKADNALEARATTHLYVCEDTNFGGYCQNLVVTKGNCCEFFP